MKVLINRQCVKIDETIRDAWVRLNDNSGYSDVLFVLNEYDQVIGTLTDGDIRRTLLSGVNINSCVTFAMHSDFSFINIGEVDKSRKIAELRERKILIVPFLDDEKHLIKVLDLTETKSILPIDAVLMAGGKGERLRPLTLTTPKPLLQVGGKAIIDYNIERLISYGVEHISVTVNYLREQLDEHFAMPIKNVKVNTIGEPKFLGTIGSIQFIPEFYNDIVLVMNSDLFTDIDYEEFYTHFKMHNADMSVAAVPYSIAIPYGIMELEGRNLKGMLEKPTYNYYANSGIYLIKKEMLELIPKDTFFNATDLIDMLIIANKKIVRFPIKGTWIDIGNPQEYQKAKDLVNHIKS